ncbi:hypothetical protein B0H11DRAFT_2435771 [Mycena galericulata]|nr:hypothetical protein B0H11DRAFT_2435771 [Mycena galericulata]
MSSSSSELAPDREAHENIIKTILYHELLEKHLVPPKELGIPLKQLYPGDWNWHFEQVYRRKYGPDADPEAWRAENFDYFDLEMLSYVRNLGLCNQEIARTSKILLREEGMLVGMAIEELTALEIEAKRGFVLDGLVRGAFQAREKSRFDCPEMSLFGLSGDGEYKLVNLLKAIVAHDPTGNLRVKSLYLFSHPAVEREYGYASKAQTPDKMRAFGYLRIIQRNLYIVQTLIGILEAYAGKPAPEISIKAEAEAKQRQACYSCGAASTEDGVALRRCSGCKLVSVPRMRLARPQEALRQALLLQELAYMGQRYELAEMEAQGVKGDVAQEEREYDHEDVKDEWENISKEDSGSEGDVDDEELYEVQA